MKTKDVQALVAAGVTKFVNKQPRSWHSETVYAITNTKPHESGYWYRTATAEEKEQFAKNLVKREADRRRIVTLEEARESTKHKDVEVRGIRETSSFSKGYRNEVGFLATITRGGETKQVVVPARDLGGTLEQSQWLKAETAHYKAEQVVAHKIARRKEEARASVLRKRFVALTGVDDESFLDHAFAPGGGSQWRVQQALELLLDSTIITRVSE